MRDQGWLSDAFGPIRHRQGFALPAAILALMVVAVLITGGFFLAGQEARIGQSTGRATQAFYLAESGLNEVLAGWVPAQAGLALWEETSACADCQIQQGDGEWDVTITRVDDLLYLIESTGRITQGGRLAGASRTLSQLARGGTLDLAQSQAAVTTQDQMAMSGNSTVDGRDTNGGGSGWFMNQGANSCPAASGGRPALLVNETATVSLGGNSKTLAPSGVDPVGRDDALVDEQMDVFSAETWERLTSLADKTITASGAHKIEPSVSSGECNTGDPLNWGAPRSSGPGINSTAAEACKDYFPIIHVVVPEGEDRFQINANSSGQGILLIDGNLHLNGNFNWAGPMYVKGRFTNNGGTGIFGSITSEGAEIESNNDEQLISGNALITYSSCALSKAISGASGSLPLDRITTRGWADLSAGSF